MNRLLLALALMFQLASLSNGQSVKADPNDGAVELERILLLSDLQSLEEKSAKLDMPLAQALAVAEIADATWPVDQEKAKKLLSQAYELTLPDENEQLKARNRPAGTLPSPPTALDRARSDIRNRVLRIASRDRAFANQIVQSSAKKLGKYDEHFNYSVLARNALNEGNTQIASQYVLQAVEADPSVISAGFIIRDMAAKDRAAADELIIQYIEQLRAFPLSIANQSAARTYSMLYGLVFTGPSLDGQGRQIPPPGPNVMRAYVSYILESLGKLEQSQPGALKRARPILLTAWEPLQRYAPALANKFLELESLSRRPGDDASLPTRKNNEEAHKERYEKQLKESLDSDRPDELTINFAISKGDFDKARKLIGKLADGPQKTQLTEAVNTKEALSLATKGDIAGAESLAEKLNKAASILQVYPVIIGKCVAKKDQPCASNSTYKAMLQLRRADVTPIAPPVGVPVPAMATSQELDPVSSSLGKLAKLILPINETLALEVLDEMVSAANVSPVDTGLGRLGFDLDVFRRIAEKNELRSRQSAESFKDPLRRIVSLAAIYQWKAEELKKKVEANH